MSSTGNGARTVEGERPLLGRAELRRFLAAALLSAIREEPSLLDDDAHEVAVMFRIGWYLMPMIESAGRGLHVDCEYNRMTDSLGNRSSKTLPPSDSDQPRTGDENVRPDLIVHRRGFDDCNLLVVEARKQSRLRRDGSDRQRRVLS